jgi:hypothetical protein
MEEYVQKLCEEIRYTAKTAQKAGLNLKTIYIGGGTPTAISADQLKAVMQTVKENFDLSKVEEYTVEAGRPDCTTREKLQIIKDFGADRVSINPQTFSDDVLKAIGRKHTHQDFVDCYKMAREIGFKSINTDLIAGKVNDAGYISVAQKLTEKFGFKKVAITLRSSISASDNEWGAMLYSNGKAYFSPKYLIHIVDRVGGGDSFGGGLIYSTLMGYSTQDSVEFAVAASCLKHSIEGDFNMVSVDEVKALAGGNGTGRIQR